MGRRDRNSSPFEFGLALALIGVAVTGLGVAVSSILDSDLETVVWALDPWASWDLQHENYHGGNFNMHFSEFYDEVGFSCPNLPVDCPNDAQKLSLFNAYKDLETVDGELSASEHSALVEDVREHGW